MKKGDTKAEPRPDAKGDGRIDGQPPVPPNAPANLPPVPLFSEEGKPFAGPSSRASDAGSIESEHSTATLDTTTSAGTLASVASTTFFNTQVHFFSLDDFAGHEIQTILEDGENEQNEGGDTSRDSPAGAASVGAPSIVSNIEERLGDIAGFPGGGGPDEKGGAASSSSARGAGSSAGHAAESQYVMLLEQMQHRELTSEDMQLLMSLEQKAAQLGHSLGAIGAASSGYQLGGSPGGYRPGMGITPDDWSKWGGGSGGGGSVSAGSITGGSLGGGSIGGGSVGGGSVDGGSDSGHGVGGSGSGVGGGGGGDGNPARASPSSSAPQSARSSDC